MQKNSKMKSKKKVEQVKKSVTNKTNAIDTNDVLWLSSPMHKNSLKVELTDDIKRHLLMSFDGTILGVSSAVVSSFIKDEGLRMIRLGFEKMPNDILKYSDTDGLYKFLSCLIDIE